MAYWGAGYSLPMVGADLAYLKAGIYAGHNSFLSTC